MILKKFWNRLRPDIPYQPIWTKCDKTIFKLAPLVHFHITFISVGLASDLFVG